MTPISRTCSGPPGQSRTRPPSAVSSRAASSAPPAGRPRPQTDLRALEVEERGRRFQAECPAEQRVVAQFGVRVERQVGAVDGQAGVEGALPLPVLAPDHRLQPTPEQAVMHQQEIHPAFGRRSDRVAAGIDRRADARDRAAVLQLQAVERVRVVRNLADVQEAVEVSTNFAQDIWRDHRTSFGPVRDDRNLPRMHPEAVRKGPFCCWPQPFDHGGVCVRRNPCGSRCD